MRNFTVTGMSCAACSARVEKAVSSLEGVEICSVNLLTNSMSIEGSASDTDIIKAVEKAGYGAKPKTSNHLKNTEEEIQSIDESISDEGALEDTESRRILIRLSLSVILLVPLMYLTMGHTMLKLPLPDALGANPPLQAMGQLIITSVIMLINKKFFLSGIKGAVHLAPNMDTLVALGSGVSYIYSLYILMKMIYSLGLGQDTMHMLHALYFESAAMILTLITLGKLLEAKSKGRTTNAIKSLINLAPKKALVLRDGEEVEVMASSLKKDDVFLLKPGFRVPADGVVIEGYSSVDESALTGESIPVDKIKGSTVSAATINQNGFLKCRATNVGGDTALAQIIRLVEEASASKAPISKIADRVSGYFVPVVMGLSLLTFAVWLFAGYEYGFALERAITILVISCPCALGLATPVAIMVGSGKGASNGIMFKTATALEIAGKTKIVALDKTGTITKGKPNLAAIVTLSDVSEEELLKLAAILESKSEHPLARAVIERADSLSLKLDENLLEDFKSHSGNGISGVISGVDVACGKEEFIGAFAPISQSVIEEARRLSKEGMTVIYVAKSGVCIGLLGISDSLKEDSKEAIKQLKGLGIKTVMLTGDNNITANVIGKEAGVDEIYSQVMPQDKERIVSELMNQGSTMMVGDGINDGPALTRADTGVAIGSGTEVAIDAADIVLVKNSLMDVVGAIRLSRYTLRNIHQNLFWAFFYNVLGIPLAAGVLIPFFNIGLNPMFGAAAMSLSSFCVVTNALRINLFNIYGKHRENNKENNKENNRENNREVVPNKDMNQESNEYENKCSDENIINKKGEDIMKKTLKIEGMMCGHCEATVKKALEALEGVESASVSHEKGTAEVVLKGEVSDDVLKKAVEDKEYTLLEIM